jgi:hypothetical protein
MKLNRWSIYKEFLIPHTKNCSYHYTPKISETLEKEHMTTQNAHYQHSFTLSLLFLGAAYQHSSHINASDYCHYSKNKENQLLSNERIFSLKMAVFWVLAPSAQPRRQPSSYSQPWEPEISEYPHCLYPLFLSVLRCCHSLVTLKH